MGVSAGVIGLLVLLGAGLALVVLVGSALTAHRLRRPPRRTAAWAAAKNAPADPGELDNPREFRTGAFRGCEYWEIPGDASEGPLVVVSPGWGDSKIGALPRLAALTPWASRVIAWDPPGLGVTPGRCGLGVTEPALLGAMLKELADGHGTVLCGWSLGAGVSLAAGHGAGVIGVIAEAPYRLAPTPARNVLRGAGLPYRINLPLAMAAAGARLGIGPAWRGFDRAEHAAALRVPVLVLHGSDDAVSPVQDGRDIAAAAARGTMEEIEGGGHNDLWTDDRFRGWASDAVTAFGRSLTGSPAASRG